MIDSNVLVYAVDPRDPTKQETAQQAIATLRETGRGILCAQVLGEYFRVVTQRIDPKLPHEIAERRLLTLSLSFPVFDTTIDSVREGARIVQAYGLGVWDGVICAIAAANGASMWLTEDHVDGRSIDGVRIVNPFAINFDLDMLRST